MDVIKKYLQDHLLCKKAIEEFLKIKSERNDNKLSEWKKYYAALNEKISYGPPGLPRITSSYYDGIIFTYISRFHSLFEKIDFYYSSELEFKI